MYDAGTYVPTHRQFVKMAALTRVGVLSETLLWRNTSLLFKREYFKLTRESPFDVARRAKYPDILLHTPDPYPKTKEEREKAAAKYNMHPGEYKPIPNDHRYSGDYPDLPKISVEAKDPYYPWDFPHIRRNYGEPVHKEFDIMTEDRYGFGIRERVTDLQGTLIYWGIIGAFIFLYNVLGETSQPLMEKQWPHSDKVHYTFNLVK